jgi:hypothetical protein
LDLLVFGLVSLIYVVFVAAAVTENRSGGLIKKIRVG